MNRYLILMALIPIIPIIVGYLYYFAFRSKKMRTFVRCAVPGIYALLIAFFIAYDSFDGITAFWHKEQLNTDISYSRGMVLPTALAVAFILFLICFFLLDAPALNYAVYKRLAKEGTTFSQYLVSMSEIKKRRRTERKSLKKMIKDAFNFDEENEEQGEDGVYFNLK